MIYETSHLGINDEFHMSRPRDLNYPLHIHGTYEIYWVLHGSTEIRIGDSRIHMSAGDCAVIFPHVRHGYSSESGTEALMCIFSPSLVRSYSRAHDGQIPESPCFRPRSVPPECEPENIYRRKAFLYSVLGELEENTAYLSATRGRDEVMTERILAYIDENYSSPDCDLKALSTHLGYDYTYVSKFFSANLSVGFRRFMNLYRIHKAQLLLREEDVTVTEAAFSVGYSSVRNFNYEFLSITGMTPGEYRRGERK